MQGAINMKLPMLIALLLFAISPRAQGQDLQIVTDIAPVGSLVSMVVGEAGSVTVILANNASAHNFSLRPSHARAIANADVVFWVGDTLTPWLHGPLENLTTSAQVVELAETSKKHALPARRQEYQADDDHGHTGHTDPHMWMDPNVAQDWITTIEATLIAVNPLEAQRYSTNATIARQQIQELHERLSTALKPFNGFGFVAMHDALQYFETAYGLKALMTLTFSDDAPPGPRQMQAVQSLLESGTVACLIVDPHSASGLLDRFSQISALTVRQIDILGGSLDPGPQLNLDLIQNAANSMQNCLNH
jgi:zinc transport system substrate-binding protein